ncbi:Glyoxalase family protein [Agrobacterium tumefaciens str. Kerr 14]|uniref:Glyoxalase family protein n=1 Tax=Agrobacterium tumefaciens str. Kerr 14 TaxID=1183424 RepID=A0A1S7S9Y8_AGRTU|nr:VOC family protein [Agrobacterium tumefaciens]CUX64944.1 Glyoxalase family protein [Agrobacterium tumefaciens str. Kerr 14]
MTAQSSTAQDSSTDTVATNTKPYQAIDHIAIAVKDLDAAILMFRDILGFELGERRHIKGQRSGMVSAEMEANGIRFVLCQGTEPTSQVSQLIEHHGIGVAHIALSVDDVEATVSSLKSQGLEFDTKVIKGPGLTQAFSSRCEHTGLSFEFIQRSGESGFLEANVQQLFDELEQANRY